MTWVCYHVQYKINEKGAPFTVHLYLYCTFRFEIKLETGVAYWSKWTVKRACPKKFKNCSRTEGFEWCVHLVFNLNLNRMPVQTCTALHLRTVFPRHDDDNHHGLNTNDIPASSNSSQDPQQRTKKRHKGQNGTRWPTSQLGSKPSN